METAFLIFVQKKQLRNLIQYIPCNDMQKSQVCNTNRISTQKGAVVAYIEFCKTGGLNFNFRSQATRYITVRAERQA